MLSTIYVDTSKLQLPKKTCASYMRREELKTINDAHKAKTLCEYSTKQKGLLLNTDGTTKQQKKLGGTVVNNMVLGVNELDDGKGASAIADISSEFETLRRTAHALHLPNPNSINWTLVLSSTSDSASTQKKMNKLIEDCRLADKEKYGPANNDIEALDLIETFCSMHLGSI